MSYPAGIFDGADEFCAECDDTFLESCADDGHLPLIDPEADFHWVICDRCQGEGWLRGYPGVYTQDEFEEAFGNDPDEYINHRRTCEDCEGLGRERVIRDEAMTRPGLMAWVRDFYESRAVEAAERRAGA